MFKRKVALGLLVVMLGTALVGCNSGQADTQEASSGSETVVAEKTEEELAEEKRLEEEAKRQAEEEKRLAEEKRLEEERKRKEIEEKTYYVKNDDINVRSGAGKEHGVIGSLDLHTPVLIADQVTDEEGNVTWMKLEESLVADQESWVAASMIVKTKVELITKRYDGVDYNAFEKVVEYKNNPRVKVKGIYVTAHSTVEKIDELIELANNTEINAFIIDVKDDNGNMLFETEAAEKYCPEANDKRTIKDIDALVKRLKEHDIYLIARIVTFKSPRYAKRYPERAISYKGSNSIYRSRDGISWASPSDKELWDYNLAVCKEAAEAGFNEIQFDYVRYPATGPALDRKLDFKNENDESKPLVIQNFLKYAREELAPYEVYIAADIFGWAATNITDSGIGQHWEAVSNVVDYNCPMMYPSHYGPGIFGFAVPDARPYGTIDASIKDGLMRDEKLDTPATLRPWIQAFTAKWVKGYIQYGGKQIREQIQALEDNGVDEFILWNAVNRYSESGLLADERPVKEVETVEDDKKAETTVGEETSEIETTDEVTEKKE